MQLYKYFNNIIDTFPSAVAHSSFSFYAHMYSSYFSWEGRQRKRVSEAQPDKKGNDYQVISLALQLFFN